MGKDEYTEETPLTAVPDEPQFARTGCNALPCPVNLFSPKAEHRLGMIGVAAVGFIDCVSYGVIMPSIWAFLNEYGGSPHELGFALSAFSFAQLISYPIVGFWADRRSIKVCRWMILGCLLRPVVLLGSNVRHSFPRNGWERSILFYPNFCVPLVHPHWTSCCGCSRMYVMHYIQWHRLIVIFSKFCLNEFVCANDCGRLQSDCNDGCDERCNICWSCVGSCDQHWMYVLRVNRTVLIPFMQWFSSISKSVSLMSTSLLHQAGSWQF